MIHSKFENIFSKQIQNQKNKTQQNFNYSYFILNLVLDLLITEGEDGINWR